MFGNSTSTGSFGAFGSFTNGPQLGRHIEVTGSMEAPVTSPDVLRMAEQAAATVWPDYPPHVTRPVMAQLFGALGREVNARRARVEFVLERRGYKQTVLPKQQPEPPDGEWPVPWFAVIETQRERL